MRKKQQRREKIVKLLLSKLKSDQGETYDRDALYILLSLAKDWKVDIGGLLNDASFIAANATTTATSSATCSVSAPHEPITSRTVIRTGKENVK